MAELRKKYSEIIALYKLEKDLRDIYVEGNADKIFFDNFLRRKKSNRKVIPIETIDFAEFKDSKYDDLDIKSNRNKLLILSDFFSSKLTNSQILCIIDKDFDDFIKSFTNSNLLKTDFSCLESYIFCEDVIDKFLSVGINNFPVETSKVIIELSNVLKSLFCIRLAKSTKYSSLQLLSIDKNITINKQSGKIEFNHLDYIDKFLHKNNSYKERDKFIALYDELHGKCEEDIRHYIHGHDFLDIFYLYINIIKNTPKYKEENLGKVLFLTVEISMIENFPLFQSIAI
jgi:hypothetical protein